MAMGYGDDSWALKLSLKKKARNERRLRRSQAKDEKNIEVSSEERRVLLKAGPRPTARAGPAAWWPSPASGLGVQNERR